MATQREQVFDEEFLARLGRLSLMAKRLARGRSAGGRRTRRLGDGLEFADHRDYAPGDDVRFMDWPYYARMEKLLRRLFHEHSEAGVAILLDTSASMAPPGERARVRQGGRDGLSTFDYSRRVAAAMAYVAMAAMERVWIYPFAERLRRPLHTSRSGANILGVLDFLADLAPAGRTDLLGCIRRLADQADRPTTVLIISDLLDVADELSESLAVLSMRRCDVSVLQVHSPGLSRPALLGPTELVGAEDDGRLAIDITDDILTAYEQRWDAFVAGCQRTCHSRGAIYLSASSDMPLEKFVLLSLRRAGILTG